MTLFPSSGTRALFFALFVGFLGVGAWLPSATKGVFASPDETAVVTIVETMLKTGRASIPEPLALRVPWLHPRSWVSSGPSLVPVGFLGWPILLAPFIFLFGNALLPWIGLFLIASAMYPVFRLFAARFGNTRALAGTALLFFFPTVVLYANRGLFANGPQLALLAWWLFFTRKTEIGETLPLSGKAIARSFLIGLLTLAIILIRPVEGVWILPWMWWWGRKREWTQTEKAACLIGAVPLALVYVLIVSRTYGDPFAIGYLLRDNPLPAFEGIGVQRLSPLSATRSWGELLPYGFHPRHVWWNLRSFTRELLWPWCLGLLAIWMPILSTAWRLFRTRGLKTITSIPFKSLWSAPVLLSLWMAVFLFSVYGSGLYADHIRPGAVTIGNSFLRYLLPLLPLGIYFFLIAIEKNAASVKATRFSYVIAVFLCIGGLFTVFAKDDEGLFATRRELRRYTSIRAAARELLPADTVVLSERSDKIFFPIFRTVSPLPSLPERARLTQIPDISVALFARPLSQAERDAWRAAGVVPQELESFGRERLYRLLPLSR
jgi:hypothetical protein